MKYLDNLPVLCLEEALKKGTFNAIEYFLQLEKGVYVASPNVFFDIVRHPTVVWDYRTRLAKQGMEPYVIEDKMTVFNSISQYHLEFINGVVIVKKENK